MASVCALRLYTMIATVFVCILLFSCPCTSGKSVSEHQEWPETAEEIPKARPEQGVPRQTDFKARQIRQAQNKDGTEAWGYVDVRPGAHTFYWLYHSYHADGYLNRPLIIWFQGGPGASSCGYGNFELIGPLDLNLNERNTTWVKEANVLFIDNPVGAGYSYVDVPSAFTTDVQQITDDLTTFIQVFMDYFPQFKTIPLYVFGQSYGGKMGSHFARHLYNEVKAGRVEANIVAFAMGNSWISPIDSTLTWGPLLYQMALVDDQGLDAIQRSATLCQRAVEAGRWEEATRLWSTTEAVVSYRTHYVDFYNILRFSLPGSSSLQYRHDALGPRRTSERHAGLYLPSTRATDPLYELMNGPIREKLGIIPENVTWDGQSDDVFTYQEGDFMKPVVDVVADALENTTLQVIVYQGQLDLICDTVGALNWVQQLKWSSLENFNNATRKWFVNDNTRQTEMYVKAYNKFKFYWVLGGGHSVAKDNGDTSYRMLQRILANSDT